MARAALQRRKLDAAGLGVQTAGNGVCQEARRAGQSLVAERIHRVDIVGQLADIAAILELDALGHGDDNGRLLLLHPLDLIDEVIHIERNLGRQIMSTPSQSSALASAAAAVSQPHCGP